jgi:hypothetical protein
MVIAINSDFPFVKSEKGRSFFPLPLTVKAVREGLVLNRGIQVISIVDDIVRHTGTYMHVCWPHELAARALITRHANDKFLHHILLDPLWPA